MSVATANRPTVIILVGLDGCVATLRVGTLIRRKPRCNDQLFKLSGVVFYALLSVAFLLAF